MAKVKGARIAIVHATRNSLQPIMDAFAKLWPEAEPINLLDESLLIDRQLAGELTPELSARIATLARHGEAIGGRCVLFSCSAFGAAIEAAGAELSVPVLRAYEAMIERALEIGPRLGLVATFQPTIDEMTVEIEAAAKARGIAVVIDPILAEGALDALGRDDHETHDAKVVEAALKLPKKCDVVLLAQYSMAPMHARIEKLTKHPTLSSPACAVEKIKGVLSGATGR
ncbi:MAG: aspartate/glutamate racemase family protein [Proteobacteria bacterium]|nr:aspartate/glutamate racemase family protein [Pseudomonadota bacterium]